ncbi:MAG: toxin-antitoxin system YwqK family antitoxin [Bacteroidales bacterium]|nr:toxin-antitoxin system YwqK family antitoxin [Bacteroidales bacterium]
MNTKIFLLAAFLLSSIGLFSQNVGQKGDTLLNYTDINGKKQGHWIKHYSGNTIMYDGYFIDDKPVGLLKRYHPNGKIMAEMNHEKKTDVCRAKLYSEGETLVAEGKYIGQLKDSVWVYYGKNKTKIREEVYVNGVLQGTQKIYNDEGILIDEMDFVNGKMEGNWKQNYHTGDRKFAIGHKNGVRHGEYAIFHENGSLLEKGQYKDGLADGVWTYYDNGGHKKYDVVYKDGEIIRDGGLAKEKAEKYKKSIEDAGKVPDPSNYMSDPEEYLRQSQKARY